jgi:hypothetical protein
MIDDLCLFRAQISENDIYLFLINISCSLTARSGGESHKDEFGLRTKAFSRRLTSI